MSGEPNVTIVGNLGADPELKFTASGKAVANLSIGSTPRRFDKSTGQYQDGETLWVRAHVWGEAAENAAESLRKGDRVIAQGRLVQNSYTAQDGQKRTSIEMHVEEVGPALRYARAQVQRRPPRGATQNAPQGVPQGTQAPQQPPSQWGSPQAPMAPQGDPWNAHVQGGF